MEKIRSFSGIFAGLLGLATFLVVGEGVSGIDLHDIVDQAHQHDLCDIYGFIGIFAEKVGHDGHMPGMFCVIFPAAMAGEMCLAQDISFLYQSPSTKSNCCFKRLSMNDLPPYVN